MFVEDLVKCLDAMKISCWFDKQEIHSGDSIPQKINDGLRTSTYGVLILSSDYLREDKVWTWEELWALINIEATSPQRRIIPIRFGLDHAELTRLAPLIAHRLSIDFIGRPQEAAEEIALILKRDTRTVRSLSGENIPETGLPARHNVPMTRPAEGGFIGREPFITSLIDQLAAGRERDLSEFGILVLSGIPGFGKSTVACELAYRVGRQFPGGVFWFDARSTVTLKFSFEEIKKLLHSVVASSSGDEVDSDIFLGNMRRYLENQPCLIIFDALDSESVVSDLMQLMPRTGLSRMVITTRTERLDLPIKTISVPVVGLDLPSASKVLMQFRTVHSTDVQLQAIANICSELGYLPLALQLAARYLRGHSLSLLEYLERLRSRGPTWKGLASTIQTLPSIVEVLKLSIEDIYNRGEVGELAIKILRRCAAIDFLQGGGFYRWEEERTMFRRLPFGLATSVGVDKSDEDAVEQFDDAIEILEKVGLIRLNHHSGADIWIHALTLQFARDYLDAEDAKYLAFRLHINWMQTRHIMSGGEWVGYFREMYNASKHAIPLMKRLCPEAALDGLRTFYEMADFSDQTVAEDIVDEAITFVKTLEKNLDNEVLTMNLCIARAYSIYKAGRLTEAENLYEKLFDDLKTTAIRTDDLSNYLFYFGCLLLELGSEQRKSRAFELWDQAIAMLTEELALIDSKDVSREISFEMKLQLARLLQAKTEKFPDLPLNENQMLISLLSELEPRLETSVFWVRQFLEARGPVVIKMGFRSVRRIPIGI